MGPRSDMTLVLACNEDDDGPPKCCRDAHGEFAECDEHTREDDGLDYGYERWHRAEVLG